jgi:hypothetical protein
MKKNSARSRHSRLLLCFLFALVSHAERCSLKNFGSPWHVVAAGFQALRQKEKKDETFYDAR